MKLFKAFIAGIVIPSILLPLVVFVFLYLGKPQPLSFPFIHAIPLIWGVWNVLYFTIWKKMLPANLNIRLLLTGAILGFFVASYGVFWLHVPTIMGVPKKFMYLPLIVGPILYALLWRVFVKPLNALLGLTES